MQRIPHRTSLNFHQVQHSILHLDLAHFNITMVGILNKISVVKRNIILHF